MYKKENKTHQKNPIKIHFFHFTLLKINTNVVYYNRMSIFRYWEIVPRNGGTLWEKS